MLYEGRERLKIESCGLYSLFGNLQVDIGTHTNLGNRLDQGMGGGGLVYILIRKNDGLPEQMGGSLSMALPSGDPPPWIS